MKHMLFSFCAASLLVFSAVARDHTTDPDRYFLTLDQVLDSREFLPAPPDTASARYAYDVEQYEWGKHLRDIGDARALEAAHDAVLDPNWSISFSDAFGVTLHRRNAPAIVDLIENMQEDVGDLATRQAKEYYMRERPFMVFDAPLGSPDDKEVLRKNGSYPSGHAAIGWATALVLAEINPANQDAIMKRGYEFGQSRVICGAHFQSDVDAGRLLASAAVARLHADKNFCRKLEKAKKEFANLTKDWPKSR